MSAVTMVREWDGELLTNTQFMWHPQFRMSLRSLL